MNVGATLARINYVYLYYKSRPTDFTGRRPIRWKKEVAHRLGQSEEIGPAEVRPMK